MAGARQSRGARHLQRRDPAGGEPCGVEADVVIGLGAIVPHHIPGYSGSSKIIQPGVCGPRTTAETHMLSCEGGGDSFLGIEDNPVRRDMDDMADRVGMKTIFNVVMDSEGRVAGLFCGEMRAAFRKGSERRGRSTGSSPRNARHRGRQLLPCDLDFCNPTNPSTRRNAWSKRAVPSSSAPPPRRG